MADPSVTAPAVHVAILDPALLPFERFVGFGAEEEGVPTRQTRGEGLEPVAAAYAAARSSVFGIGLALGGGRIVLHEGHMPPEKPVLVGDLSEGGEAVARRFGANAARMVVRLPLRLTAEPELPSIPAPRRAKPVSDPTPQRDVTIRPSEDEVRRIVALVVERLDKRGAP